MNLVDRYCCDHARRGARRANTVIAMKPLHAKRSAGCVGPYSAAATATTARTSTTTPSPVLAWIALTRPLCEASWMDPSNERKGGGGADIALAIPVVIVGLMKHFLLRRNIDEV